MSHKVCSPVNEYDLKVVSHGFRLQGGQAGCLRVMGMFFMTPAIFMLLALFQLISVRTPEPLSGEWYGLLGLALAFLGFGLFLGFYRGYTDIDLRKREVRVMQGLWHIKTADKFLLDKVTELIVSRTVIPDSDGPDDVVFPVMFLASNGQNYTIGHYRDMADALRVALTIADRMGLKAYDATVAARLEIQARDIISPDKNISGVSKAPAYDVKGLSFEWDGHEESLSRLYTASRSGDNFYKVEYPKFLIQRFLVLAFAFGFYIYLFGWRIDKTAVEIFGGFFDPRFLSSAEVFFSTVIGSVFVTFLLIGPIINCLYSILRPAKYGLIGVGNTGLYLHDPDAMSLKRRFVRTKSHHMLVRYTDIKGLDIKLKPIPKSRKQWKVEKVDNFIALRIGTKFYEVACGLDHEQLLKIASDIRRHIMGSI